MRSYSPKKITLIGTCIVLAIAATVIVTSTNYISSRGSAFDGNVNVTGNMQIKGGTPWVDVKAYGAKGDNTNDDSQEFQNAINSLATGGEVYVPCGNFKITRNLNITCNVPIKLIGSGSCSVLNVSASNVDMLTIGRTTTSSNNSCGISNVLIYGKNTNYTDAFTTGTAITAVNLKNTIIRDVMIISGNGGILLKSEGTNNEMYNTLINNVFVEKNKEFGLKIITKANGNNNWITWSKVSDSYFVHNGIQINMTRERNTGENSYHSFSNTYIETQNPSQRLLELNGVLYSKFVNTQFEGIFSRPSNKILLNSSSGNNMFLDYNSNVNITDLGYDNTYLSPTYGFYQTSTLNFFKSMRFPYISSGTDGNKLIIHRQAASGNGTLDLYVDKNKHGTVEATNGDVVLKAKSGNKIAAAYNNYELGASWQTSGNYIFYHYGTITASPTFAKAVYFQVDDTTDTYKLSRQNASIKSFNVTMPLSIENTNTNSHVCVRGTLTWNQTKICVCVTVNTWKCATLS